MENNRGLVTLKICGKDVQALANTGGSYNLISARLVEEVGLTSTMENWEITSWNLALASIQDVPVQMEGCRGQLDFVVINTDGIDVMLGREGLLQISQAVEQGEIADQEGEVILTEDAENVTMMEVRLEDNQDKPESCSSWTWTDESTHTEGPCDDEDMVKAELEFNQVEPESYSLAAWVDTHDDESSMKAKLEGAQVEPGS